MFLASWGSCPSYVRTIKLVCGKTHVERDWGDLFSFPTKLGKVINVSHCFKPPNFLGNSPLQRDFNSGPLSSSFTSYCRGGGECTHLSHVSVSNKGSSNLASAPRNSVTIWDFWNSKHTEIRSSDFDFCSNLLFTFCSLWSALTQCIIITPLWKWWGFQNRSELLNLYWGCTIYQSVS